MLTNAWREVSLPSRPSLQMRMHQGDALWGIVAVPDQRILLRTNPGWTCSQGDAEIWVLLKRRRKGTRGQLN